MSAMYAPIEAPQSADRSVLNISDTGLKQLPPSWSALRKLKALVAMSLTWQSINDEVIGQWAELNSLSKSKPHRKTDN